MMLNSVNVMPNNRKEKQGYIDDISKLNRAELTDLKIRQEFLLRNRKRLSKLPDKGVKIRSFYERIVEQLGNHGSIKREPTSGIILGEQNVLNNLEWNKQNETNTDSDHNCDVDETSTIKIKKASANCNENAEKEMAPTKTQKDIKQDELESCADVIELELAQTIHKFGDLLKKRQHEETSDDPIVNGYVKGYCQREKNKVHTQKYLPFRTTKSNVHDPDKRKNWHVKSWENTSATPSPSIHAPVKLLSLEESIQIQLEKNRSLQRLEKKYAEERLKRREEIKESMMNTAQQSVMSDLVSYREVTDDEDDTSSDDN
ncbi:DNA-directed RNA polymerase II subunit GRINL1A [Toxorhynchites rutilus septentrionalis]|uniref:DNA-directed RNA polymerase II subunit GRINL1A n=1 Tax=Toxorhynchites rutilus septentrionalis TaxID=329112 RepID=UPI00247AC46D|nr:DNA-directed RNA polymerase II subunit GRINL1A [Toxorhynchites rutilus septentrionalis]